MVSFLKTEEGADYYSQSSATTLLPGQDNSAPSSPMSGAPWFVVSGGVRLSEVGFAEIRKPQVKEEISKRVAVLYRTPKL